MLPISNVLTKRARKIFCSNLLPVLHKIGINWFKNTGKQLIPVAAPPKLTFKALRNPLKFEDIWVQNFDQNGLYDKKALAKTHELFFQAHDLKLINEDVSEGLSHGISTYRYDLSPVSSSNGFLHWAQNTVKQYLGPFSFITDGIGYIMILILSLCVIIFVKKLRSLVANALNGA